MGGSLAAAMSPEGHLRRFDRAPLTSAVALKADIRLRRNVRRGGPQTDMSRCVRKIGSRKWTRLELPNASLRDLGELAAEIPSAQPFAMRTLGTCSRAIEPIAKPLPTFAGHL